MKPARPSPAAPPPEAFRVRVRMTRYFSDERARAYVWVRPARRVRWLARRLRALFALPPRLALLSRGHLLPPDEPLALLRPDDAVDVVPSRANRGGDRARVDEPASVSREIASSPESGVDDSDAAGDGYVTDRYSSAAEPESEVVGPSPTEVAEADEENDLSEHKRRALNMLDRYCGKDQFDEEAQPAPRPRRRRVRRRRREPPPAPSPAPAPAAGDGAVLRNGTCALGPRAPRVVHPLADRVLSS